MNNFNAEEVKDDIVAWIRDFLNRMVKSAAQ